MSYVRSRFGLVVAAVLAGLTMVLGGVVAVGSASAAPSASAVQYDVPRGLKTYKVTASALRFRAAPGGWVKGLLFRGDRVHVRQSVVGSPWVQVVTVGKSRSGISHETRGWVHRSYLRR
ncbi:hypothetical protein [Streptomyces sp. CFMR 7]|uniref:hypothetical protein n=1 Tax=Streptomyces sp. CFMR 7 TaxID=1649184 RepID=UPI0011A7834E|nr:hypothetical protein [Streptomyces sp. CFMR 7]